jgi:hypothetical integral membrane protein (TIGR02206 family)
MTNGELRMTIQALFKLSIVSRQPSTSPPVFHAFNAQHLIILGAIVALGVAIAWAAAIWQPVSRKWLGRFIGFLLLGYAAVFYIQQWIGRSLCWQYSLPLELCSLVLIACILCMFWPNPLIAEIAYFWGLGGVLQAIATPDLGWGFPSWEFILFFWGHGATVLAIVYLIASRCFRPRRGSILRMMVALNLYGLIVGAIDAVMGWNYGYLCQKPFVSSLLDFLGPWPWYLLSLELIALVSFFLLDLPWRLLILFRKKPYA